ncbi:MAG: hypothetical protein KAJ47_00275 [Candidatus Aenigmarchaeota archaeon]|nr:hypothetical protein [Candidatus Aenigmarchaeota archaeon]
MEKNNNPEFEPKLNIPKKKETKKEKNKYSFDKDEKKQRIIENLTRLREQTTINVKKIFSWTRKNPHYVYILILFFMVSFMIHEYSISNNVHYRGDLSTLVDSTQENTRTIDELTTTTTDTIKSLTTNISTLSNQLIAQKSITERELTSCNNDLSTKNQEITACNTEKELKNTELNTCQTSLEEKEQLSDSFEYILDKYNINTANDLDAELERLRTVEENYNNIPNPIKDAYK